MVAALRNTVAGGVRGIFANWYPRWGTNNILFAFNGIYNAGAESEHSPSAASWTDIARGSIAAKFNSSSSAPLWNDNGLRFDSRQRALRLDISLANITKGFTFEAFGYWGVNWGVAASLSQDTSVVSEFMPSGNNIGATVNLHSSPSAVFAEYYIQGRPTTSDLCLTCTANGSIVIYADGNPVLSKQSGAEAFTKCKTATRLVVGATPDGLYAPSGTILYGITSYQDVLTASEVLALYKANLKNYLGIEP